MSGWRRSLVRRAAKDPEREAIRLLRLKLKGEHPDGGKPLAGAAKKAAAAKIKAFQKERAAKKSARRAAIITPNDDGSTTDVESTQPDQT